MGVGNEDYAGFVSKAIEEVINNHLQLQRKQFYDLGWKDAKSKKNPKRDWFPRGWKWLA